MATLQSMKNMGYISKYLSVFLTVVQADSQTTVNLCQKNLPFVKYFSTNFTNCIFHIQSIPNVYCMQAEKLCNI
jgi:hypothetical protein